MLRWNPSAGSHVVLEKLSFRDVLYCSTKLGWGELSGCFKPIPPRANVFLVSSSSTGCAALALLPNPFSLNIFFINKIFPDVFSMPKLFVAGACEHGRSRKKRRKPLRYVCSDPGSYSPPFFFFSLFVLSRQKSISIILEHPFSIFCWVAWSSLPYVETYHCCSHREWRFLCFSWCFLQPYFLWIPGVKIPTMEVLLDYQNFCYHCSCLRNIYPFLLQLSLCL